MPGITVNGVAITEAEIAREAQYRDAPSAEAALAEAARALTVRELLLQRAGALGLVAAPLDLDDGRETEEEALIRAVLEAEVQAPVATEAECRRYYETHRQRFRGPDAFEAVRGHIASYLQEASWRRAVAQYIALLAGQASIEGVELRASASPLVQ
jgi:peptidyl-prolyl cis-trans isomerase C